MRKRWLVPTFLCWATLALAQGNPQCPTRPTGDSTNACASTAFVQNAVGGGGGGGQWNVNVGDVYRPAGNVGINVVPVAWGATYKGLQVGSTAFMTVNGVLADILANVYWTGAVFKYLNTGTAAVVAVNDAGGVGMYTFPSGTVGNNATPTQKFFLSNTGALTLSGYGAGVANFSSSGLVSSNKAYTTSTIYASDYGVTANGVTDDTLALISAVASCNNGLNAAYKGGRLVLPVGRIVVTSANLPANGIDISNCTEIGGSGGAGGYGGTLVGTEIYTTCTTCKVFIHSSLVPPYLHDFGITLPNASTTGYSMWVKTSVANAAGHGLRIERMRFEGGYIQLQLLSQANYSINNNAFIDTAFKMLYVTIDPTCSCTGDLGDAIFSGNVFQEIFNTGAANSVALHINPGGGIAVIGNKFTTASSGVGSLQHLIQLTMDQTVLTGTLNIANNSIEGGSVDSILVERTAGTGNYANIIIHDNEFGGANSSGGSAIRFLTNGGTSYLQRCNIHNNIFQYQTLAVPVILVQDCPRIQITSNQIQPPSEPSTQGITVSNFAANALVRDNDIFGGAALYPSLLNTTLLLHARGLTYAEVIAIGAVAVGSQVFVTDGQGTNIPGGNYTLTNGGVGCFAVYINGAWIVSGI